MTDHAVGHNDPNAGEPAHLNLPGYLTAWVAAQRWFSQAGPTPTLQQVGMWCLPQAEPGVDIRVLLVRDSARAEATVFQVPITERTATLTSAADALIATLIPVDGPARFIYDAPHDPAFAAGLLRFILQREAYPEHVDVQAETVARGLTIAGASTVPTQPTVVSSRVLRGEQSNTSIIYTLVDDEGEHVRPVICKIFRALQPGENPDVTVQSALARAGSRCIPDPVGCIEGEWTDAREPDARARGHLAFAQEFLPNAPDAWRQAVASAEAGDDFREAARRLGVTTATLHTELTMVRPTLTPTPAVMVNIVSGMLDRLRQAILDVPQLARQRDAIERVYARALTVPWPRLQRIHGDFHLGQVLDAPGRGWTVLDFEGEPLRALTERDLPDVPLRDVAGMMRSFDYVCGTVTRVRPESDPAALAEWAATSRRAFLDGYTERSGQRVRENDPLLTAFELDKAVYETVYETRNRPDWLPLPLEAVYRIAAADRRSRNDQD